jgi:hypothetical protein
MQSPNRNFKISSKVLLVDEKQKFVVSRQGRAEVTRMERIQSTLFEARAR